MKHNPLRICAVAVFAVFAAALMLLCISACDRGTKNNSGSAGAGGAAGEKPRVTVGIQTSPAMTLVMVAKDEGLFDAEGVSVELREFTAGKFALQAFLSNSIDYAVPGEVPVALAALQGNRPRVVAQVVERTVNEVRVVARRDGGVTDPAAYFKAKPRKLATSFGGGPEFFTYSFLKRYGLTGHVTVLSQKPEDMPAALATGSVDAVAVFDPFAFFAEKQLGDRGVTFVDPSASLYSEFYVLCGRAQDIAKNPAIPRALVRALDRAADVVRDKPDLAQRIVIKYTKLAPDVVAGIWKNFVFRPALTHELIETWDQEARWATETAKVPAGTPAPNFRTEIVDPTFLREIKPDAVTLDAGATTNPTGTPTATSTSTPGGK